MTRRSFAFTAGAAALARAETRASMGVAWTSFMTARKPKDSVEFLEYAHSLGAAGIQTPLSSTETAYLRRLRDAAERYGMYLETMASLPKEDSATFERTVAASREAGAVAVRVGCLSGRRYETFSTLDEWKQWSDGARTSVFRAAPIVEKHKASLAIENHKDWTSAELSAMLRQISSEYVGACLDTGNNIALLEDPYDVAEALAPFTLSTHLKDMAMRQTEDGFELSEMPLGEGALDVARIVRMIASARPKTRITLEMITRNPLRVPCLTTKYWATFPDRSGYALARTFSLIRQRPVRALPRIDGMDAARLAALEEQNVRKCLAWAAARLG